MSHNNAAATRVKPMDNDGSVSSRHHKLKEVAPQLIAIEAWCRRVGLADIAKKLAPALDAVEKALTKEDESTQ